MKTINGRWYHHHLTGAQAEKLLLEKGVDGSFLARPSESTAGNFTLSIRCDTMITHIRIQNTGDFFDLYGGEKFASLSELIAYYMDNRGKLKEKNGKEIELRHPLLSEDPTSERWFHGKVSGKDSEKLLLEKGKDGSFLVRDSMQKPDSFVLSVVKVNSVSHIMINRTPKGEFNVGGGQEFKNLKSLVDFYSNSPMVEKDGDIVLLKQPLNATRFNISTIDNRMKQLELDTSKGNSVAGFFEEFEEMHSNIQKSKNTRINGNTAYNLEKNRYKNILPYDNTQVILRDGNPNDPGSSYINANFIYWPNWLNNYLNTGIMPQISEEEHKNPLKKYKPAQIAFINNLPTSSSFLFNEKPRFIATQGIMSNTIEDFWRMIWQERSQIIVMITKEIERGRNKCIRYWATQEEKSKVFSCHEYDLVVSHVSEVDFDHYTMRELNLKKLPKKNSSKTSGKEENFQVYHYHFTAWPDHGTPEDPSCVLDYIHDISSRQDNLNDPGPIVAHCSAGIGRTGTYIVIDMLVNYINTHGLSCEIDIAKTIQAVRDQRSGMVQTESQYRFIYKAIQQYAHLDDKKIDPNHDYSNLDILKGKRALDILEVKTDVYENQPDKQKSPSEKFSLESKKRILYRLASLRYFRQKKPSQKAN